MLKRTKKSRIKDLKWKCAFFTEDKQFGGNYEKPSELVFENGTAHFSLPPLSACYFVPGGDNEVSIDKE
jgi:hypothetical protein